MGWISTSALAAHQIALTVASIMFMVPFGISMAATVRVGHAVGARDADGNAHRRFHRDRARRAVHGGDGGARDRRRAISFRSRFSERITPDNDATATLAATLLAVGASFFIADGMQTVAAGALRGFNDTRIPLAIAALCFWVVGFPACYLLGFSLDGGAVGVWIGLSIGVALYAVLLVWRFHALTKRGYLPASRASAPALRHFLALGPRFRQPDRDRLFAAPDLAAAAAALECAALALFHRAFDILGCAA